LVQSLDRYSKQKETAQMKFFQDDRERLVWDAAKARVVADFAEQGGVFFTDDKYIQDKLLSIGYRAEGVEPNAQQRAAFEETQQRITENDPKPRAKTAFPPPEEAAAAAAAASANRPRPAPRSSSRQRSK